MELCEFEAGCKKKRRICLCAQLTFPWKIKCEREGGKRYRGDRGTVPLVSTPLPQWKVSDWARCELLTISSFADSISSAVYIWVTEESAWGRLSRAEPFSPTLVHCPSFTSRLIYNNTWLSSVCLSSSYLRGYPRCSSTVVCAYCCVWIYGERKRVKLINFVTVFVVSSICILAASIAALPWLQAHQGLLNFNT